MPCSEGICQRELSLLLAVVNAAGLGPSQLTKFAAADAIEFTAQQGHRFLHVTETLDYP